ncbi:unnamed protein product, partial [Vitis vinifera]|uniref:Uncharacterized protein n=1 Tax=Vitis vinifera TaxID=29760 RepID=D7TU18_VITVI
MKNCCSIIPLQIVFTIFWISNSGPLFNIPSATSFIVSLAATSWSILLPALFFVAASSWLHSLGNISSKSRTSLLRLKREAMWRTVSL